MTTTTSLNNKISESAPPTAAAGDDIGEDPRRVQARGIAAAKAAAIQLVFRHFVSQCLFTFVEIGAANAIGGEELTPTAIAAKLETPVNAGYLGRILRLLACEGVVTEKKARGEDGGSVGLYGLTDMGKLFQTNIPQQPSFTGIVQFHLHPTSWGAWHKLHETTVAPPPAAEGDSNGEGVAVPFQRAQGAPLFDFLQSHPEYGKRFFEAMAFYTEQQMPVILAYDWSPFNGKTVVDLGGGLGTVMEGVANAHPGIGKLISLDTESVTGMAPKPSNDKVELVVGDFFDASTIPKCDCIFMKHILHDWKDDECQEILRASYKALSDGGQLIIAEKVTSDFGDTSPQSIPATSMDILMMVFCGSFERSAEEWTTLLGGEGLFKIDTITTTPEGMTSIITCTKV